MRPHASEKLPKGKKDKAPRVAYAVCARCRLVYLRNPATSRAVRAVCPGLEDPPG